MTSEGQGERRSGAGSRRGADDRAPAGLSDNLTDFLATIQCPGCGNTFATVVRIGQAGCAGDYTLFDDGFVRWFADHQAGQRHVGKRPQRRMVAGVASRLRQLRRQLRAAHATADHQAAADLSQQIRQAGGYSLLLAHGDPD